MADAKQYWYALKVFYGQVFEIDEVRDVRRAASLKTGGDGMRYTIRIGENMTYLFFEDPRWFVEEKVVEMP